MEPNIAASLIAGGPWVENPHAERDREHRHALLESQRAARANRVGLVDRLRAFAQPKPAEPALDCCPA